jgi:hypothetical protein
MLEELFAPGSHRKTRYFDQDCTVVLQWLLGSSRHHFPIADELGRNFKNMPNSKLFCKNMPISKQFQIYTLVVVAVQD